MRKIFNQNIKTKKTYQIPKITMREKAHDEKEKNIFNPDRYTDSLFTQMSPFPVKRMCTGWKWKENPFRTNFSFSIQKEKLFFLLSPSLKLKFPHKVLWIEKLELFWLLSTSFSNSMRVLIVPLWI